MSDTPNSSSERCEPISNFAADSQAGSSTFNDYSGRFSWRPIERCPGRFTYADTQPAPSLDSLLAFTSPPLTSTRHVSRFARDTVAVVPFPDGGGLITFERSDGSCVHTLNTAAGFARKLDQLGLSLPEAGVEHE